MNGALGIPRGFASPAEAVDVEAADMAVQKTDGGRSALLSLLVTKLLF
jgi:hypothetical protein